MGKQDPKTGRDAHRYSAKTAPKDNRPTPSWAGRDNTKPLPAAKGGWNGDRDRDHAKDARAEWM